MKCPYGNNIHIVGIAGTEGSALLKYLRAKFPRVNITTHDSSEEKLFFKAFKEAHVSLKTSQAMELSREILGYENTEVHFKDSYLQGIEEAESIFVPQSWYLYPENKPLEKFKDRFRSITRLYFDLFPGKIIGVTGSHGKTTTTTIIGEIMKRAFPTTLVSGNDRRTDQVLDQLESSKKNDWLVLEISNRQLKIDLGRSPDISVITNITENHLTEHLDFAEYSATKASLLKYQTEHQWSVLNDDDPESKKLIEIDGGETFPFSRDHLLPKGCFLKFENIRIKHAEGEELVIPISELPLKGNHNVSNVLAAVAACYLARVPIDIIAQTIRSIDKIPQRCELIATIKDVEYYNDSASTAPQSTIAAIETLKVPNQKLILIMGGKSKGLKYQDLAKKILKEKVEVILLKSPLEDEMKELLSGKVIQMCNSLKAAVQLAHEKAISGDRVLLSPAGEFFVYFKNTMPDYKQFRNLVISLPR